MTNIEYFNSLSLEEKAKMLIKWGDDFGVTLDGKEHRLWDKSMNDIINYQIDLLKNKICLVSNNNLVYTTAKYFVEEEHLSLINCMDEDMVKMAENTYRAIDRVFYTREEALEYAANWLTEEYGKTPYYSTYFSDY